MMETTKRLTCEDCSNTYKSKATLYIHRRQYCLMRNTRAAQRRQNSLHNSPLNKKSASPNSSSRSSPSSAKPSIVKTPYKQQEPDRDPLAIDTPEQDKMRLKGEPQEIGEKRGTDEFEFTEDDVAYWKEFVLGTQCWLLHNKMNPRNCIAACLFNRLQGGIVCFVRANCCGGDMIFPYCYCWVIIGNICARLE